MYRADDRGPSAPHHVRPGASKSQRHPNWGHPDHDACGTGFIARLGGVPSYDIIQHSLTALERLTHRGGVDADGASGDGAGLLTSLPQAFFRARAQEQGIELPEMFAVGFAFLPSSVIDEARAAVEAAADVERLRVIGWRRVPVNTNALGRRALETMPEIWQFFVEPFHPTRAMARFEWRLSLLRKRAESLLPPRCYICSLSSQTIVYKGLLTPWQFPQFYEDLRDSSFATTFAVFHQRYSTNTQPSWHLAQPFRYVAHNGGIVVPPPRRERQRFGEFRQRFRAAAPRRPVLGRSHARHGSSGFSKRSPAFAGRARCADRAFAAKRTLGWPRGSGFLRWPVCRSEAGPQWTAPAALHAYA